MREGENERIGIAVGTRGVPTPPDACILLVYPGTAEGKQGEFVALWQFLPLFPPLALSCHDVYQVFIH